MTIWPPECIIIIIIIIIKGFYVHLQKLEQQTLQLKTVIRTPRIKMFLKVS